MEQIIQKQSQGGARAGAGRPRGSKARVSVESLLAELELRAPGESYEALLLDDFLRARLEDDKGLVLKYHNLILNKVMHTLTTVEVVEGQDAIDAKSRAFAEAIAQIVGIPAKD